jgi:aminocarboxymuconate-semialdehyde decarboxylase
MADLRTIDAHAHILIEETMATLRREVPSYRLQLRDRDGDFATLEAGAISYPNFPRGGWDLERRFHDMARAKFERQLLSVLPQTVAYDEEPAVALALSQIQNEHIAALVKRHPDRFLGVGTVPLQSPDAAAAELRRCMTELGLRGIMIGSNVGGRNFDDPGLEPVWAAAAEVGALIFIHPTTPAAADRLKDYYLRNLVGNPLDTTIAAACLVFAGVLERHSDLKILLSHGGGFLPYQAARLIRGWGEREEPKQRLKVSPAASLGRFLYDTILHGRRPLEFLIGSAGADRVLLGSDYPYDMGQYDSVELIASLSIPDADKTKILGGNALALLGTV